jgi:hypothetical protein
MLGSAATYIWTGEPAREVDARPASLAPRASGSRAHLIKENRDLSAVTMRDGGTLR